MAAWGSTDYTLINYSAVNYYFAPTELVYIGNPTTQKNQVVQESESGEQKIQQLDSNDRLIYQFSVQKMPAADRTVGSFGTVRGFDTLKTLIETTLNCRENILALNPATETAPSVFFARYNASEFPAIPLVRKTNAGAEYYGSGSQILTFRKEI